MAATEREAAVSSFLEADRKLSKSFTSTQEFKTLLKDCLCARILFWLMTEDMQKAFGFFNLATVYKITHPLYDLVGPFFRDGNNQFEKLQEHARKLLQQLRVMCHFITNKVILPDEAFADFKSILREYIDAHKNVTRWVEKELETLLQNLFIQSQKRLTAQTTSNVEDVDRATMFMTALEQERIKLEEWLSEHPL